MFSLFFVLTVLEKTIYIVSIATRIARYYQPRFDSVVCVAFLLQNMTVKLLVAVMLLFALASAQNQFYYCNFYPGQTQSVWPAVVGESNTQLTSAMRTSSALFALNLK